MSKNGHNMLNHILPTSSNLLGLIFDLGDVLITTCTMRSPFPSVEDRFGTVTVIPLKRR